MSDQPGRGMAPGAPTSVTHDPASVSFQTAPNVRISPQDWEQRVAAVRTGLAADGIPFDGLAEVLGSMRLTDEAGATWIHNGTTWLSWNGSQWTSGAPTTNLMLQPFSLEFEPDQATAPAPPLLSMPERSADEPPAVPAQQSAPAPQTANFVPPRPTQPAAAPSPPPPPPPAPPQPTVTPAAQPMPPMPQPAPAAAASPAPLPPPASQPNTVPTYRPTHVVPPTGLPAWSNPDPRSPPQFQLPAGSYVMATEWWPNGWARVVATTGWVVWVDSRYLLPLT